MSAAMECKILAMADQLTGDEFKLLIMMTQSASDDQMTNDGFARAARNAGFTVERADELLTSMTDRCLAALVVVPPYKDTSKYKAVFYIYSEDAARIHQLNQRRHKSTKRNGISTQYHKLFVAIGRRDGFACARCGNTDGDLQIDHIHPISKGGGNDLVNLQLLCPPCNLAKSDTVLEQE